MHTKIETKAGRWDAPFGAAPEGVVREEIFSAERLESHAQTLAVEHSQGLALRAGRKLAPRIRRNARVLGRCYRALGAAAAEGRMVPPAAKWLLDNFHLVAGQERAIEVELPSGYYRDLPKLGSGDLEGYPRVFGLAWKWAAHCDSHFDPETLRRFAAAYQRSQAFSIGELWALPITLRIVLIESLRRQAENVVACLRDTNQADLLADRLLGLDSGPALDPARAAARLKGRTLPAAFGARLYQRLRDQGERTAPALKWLEAGLGEGRSAETVARQVHQEQEAGNATCRNIITSLRDIALLDWRSFVESLSLVDEALQGAFDFRALSFPTRDRYRHAVEELARGSRHTELEIARFAAANLGAARPGDGPPDAGEDLVGPGRRAFERQIEYAPPLGARLRRASAPLAVPLYLGSVVLFTVWCLSLALGGAFFRGLGAPVAACLACLGLVSASEIAVTLVNHAVMAFCEACQLPALDFKTGVPAAFRTMVVIPVILEDAGGFRGLVETLEIHYLANTDGELYFGLLTDWPDAAVEEREGEAALLLAAQAEIAELNRRHGPGPSGLARFGLYHRRRRLNALEGRWMGWERKRGKLMEFNRLLRGRPGTSFADPAGGALEPPPGVRFVVTLDQDTRLPFGSVGKLAGTLAHALNRPRLNAAGDRVVRGYGILQPRVSPILLPAKAGSLFNRISSGRAGTDPYAWAVSDVYQDLFSEGSYTGKGIYDVDAFEASLDGRIPDNCLLSHDLLEGSFARAGLAGGVDFFEEFPGHYQVAAARQHRWTRGDWQLLPWIFGFGPGSGARLGIVARWKMLDNLRRSLLAPASVAALLAAWFLPLPRALAWSALVLAALALPPLLAALVTDLVPRRRDFSLGTHLRSLRADFSAGLLKFLFTAAMLPAEAWLMADAIARTLYRLFVSRRGFLEWTLARRARRGLARGWGEFFGLLKAGPVAGAALGCAVLAFRPPAWPLALGFALLWLASPALCRRFSLARPAPPGGRLGPDRTRGLRQAARRTWHYFETFVDASVNHLPPDNYQEDPRPMLAERTSPTNLGLYLLSCVAARDFGWLEAPELLSRVEHALDSMESMERHRGHFYNWYDLKTLRPLEPRFVSTVDSGNLAGHMRVARQALLGILKEPLRRAAPCQGMRDSLSMAAEAARDEGFARLGGLHQGALSDVLDALSRDVPGAPEGGAALAEQMERLRSGTETLADIAKSFNQEHEEPPVAELMRWAGALRAEWEGHAAYARAFAGDVPGAFEATLEGAAAAYAALGLPAPARAAADLADRVRAAAERMRVLCDAMRFGFLYDPGKKLFSIGFREASGELDSGCYDLLASEARLVSFLAVAAGDVDAEHWFRLGRPVTPVAGGVALLSWSGSMFEYLMPLLVMPSPPGSLLAETYRTVVRRQRRFGDERGLPWGVSESACATRDKDMTYQYSDFGVEGLGLKSGLGRHRVVAPYATALALMVDPAAAAENFRRLKAMGALGAFGYYDALDFGAASFPEGRGWSVVKTSMAHHQGMALLSFLHALGGGAMQERFMAVPMFRAAALLLQERVPVDVTVDRPVPRKDDATPPSEVEFPPSLRVFDSPHTVLPQTHLLGNGSYSVLLTASGGGYSRWGGTDVTRFRPDASPDAWGSFILIRDAKADEGSSAAYLPSRREPDMYRVLFREDKAEFIRRDGGLESRLEVAVSPEDDVEVRRLTLKNQGFRTLDLELTSYAEVSLSAAGEDASHPAFAKLFVQTEYSAELGALLAHRRGRSQGNAGAWAAHLSFSDDPGSGGVHFETDRARFLGRGRDISNSAMGAEGRLLSGTVGAVLDPVFSLRRRISLEPRAVAHVTFATMAASSRDKVLALAAKVRDGANVERLFGQAWIHAQAQMRHRGILPEEAQLFQTLAGHLLYPDPRLRSPGEFLSRNRLGRDVLWSQGISGDAPILVLRVDATSDREILRQVLQAWDYWRLKNLVVDLVVLNDEPLSYADEFQKDLVDMALRREGPPGRGAGGIHVVKACLIPAEERDLVLCAAKVVLQAGRGSLTEQLGRVQPHRSLPPRAAPSAVGSVLPPPAETLEFVNGLGGFAGRGREYRIALEDGQETPAPWINVVANPGFGFLSSESGSGYTWAGNSQENKLSPWSNDPVSDPAGEAFYVRDEESGDLFTPTALPIRLKGGQYVARHGQGYSRFESEALGIRMDLTQFVPAADPVKIPRLTLKNTGGRARRLSVTAYVEWVLGTDAQAAAPWVVTEWAADTGLLTARNPLNAAFPAALAFLDLGGRRGGFTGDRREFLGRHGGPRSPLGLAPGASLSGRVGAGLDPCGALQTVLELAPGESAEVRVLLGQARDRDHLRTLVADWRARDLDGALAEVRAFWDATLGALQVRTPDRAMDILLNCWLPYQILSCRLWARAAFYQCGGAYGFRDQLQDVLGIVSARPAVAREHLLRASGEQFPEGDVLHWWHPPLGAGVRTRVSDDRLWLPYAVARYADASGDSAVLDERTPFLEGPPIAAGKADLYLRPRISAESATLYEHCARALDSSLAVGARGLPLMGGGDWNDGMNMVGAQGRGESVWLAWFLIGNLRGFAPIAEARGDAGRAERWRRSAAELAAAVESRGWDGEWYRRAYFDDGSPLGSAGLAECRIDSIAQSWSVLSGAADPARAARAMAALEEYLWKKADGLLLLLTPPFAEMSPDPGYIMGYLPGIRENGGQYNHAAAWAVAAFAGLGDGAKAHELFAMLNPVRLAGTRAGMQRYKIEPYVMAGDVYSQAPHVGRGGWSWYTGSAAWMRRAGVESILGLTMHGDCFSLEPRIPPQWPSFELRLEWRGSRWDIRVANPDGVSGGVRSMRLDGEPLAGGRARRVPLRAGGGDHVLEVLLGDGGGDVPAGAAP